MAEDLNFPSTKSASYLSPATGILRVYRYLRCSAAEQRWGIHEHTDSSVLSIIHQDQVGGLQVFKNNQWLDVEPIHDTLIVSLGDMMQVFFYCLWILSHYLVEFELMTELILVARVLGHER